MIMIVAIGIYSMLANCFKLNESTHQQLRSVDAVSVNSFKNSLGKLWMTRMDFFMDQ